MSGRRRMTAVAILGLTGAAASVGAQELIINELLANPTGAVGSEWVELWNIADSPVDLAGWKIGDALREVVIADTSVVVPPGGYVLLVQDLVMFDGYYGDTAGIVVEPPGWAIFNNDEDLVRLINPEGREQSRFEYEQVFPGDVTWSRDPEDQLRWERSRIEGGTPGRMNEVVPERTEGGLDILVSPRIFSPDGDGVDDSVVIELQIPADAEYKLEIYDRDGRKVWGEEIGAMDLVPYYVWYGRTNAGDRLPVGVYIIFLEAVSGGAAGEGARKTVVIAR